MLDAIAQKFMDKGLVSTLWQTDVQCQAELVCLYRNYYEGEHRLKLTTEMKKMMQISDDRLDRYNDNYCEMVVNTMADRLTVDRIQATSETPPTDAKVKDPAQQWVDDLMYANRFDSLQIDVREAALRDGETFVLSEYDEEEQRIELYHELAWDGSCGVIVVMDSKYQSIVAAAKVWYEGDETRVNLYYQNSIEKYTAGDAEGGGTQLAFIEGAEDEAKKGTKDAGVPIVRFSRKKKPTSELKNVIPLQDSLNRTLVSMVMSAELTAFSVMFAKGWKPPQAITPGMIYHAMLTNADGTTVVPQSEDEAKAIVAMINAFSLERIDGGSLDQLIKQAEWLIGQIENVSSTPNLGGGQSGEYLKQLDVRMQGKIESAQVMFGNSWEDVIEMANLQQKLFGFHHPPVIDKVATEWKSAEIRNDADILALFEKLIKYGFTRAALMALSKSPLANFTAADIDKMMDEKSADDAKTTQAAAGNVPGLEHLMPSGLNFNPAPNGATVN